MASRTTSTRLFDYCLNPIHVCDEDKDVIVPCGKCSGCLLHKANTWSFRVADEIEYTPYSVFFTLTYDNFFLPRLKRLPYLQKGVGFNPMTYKFYWTSDHKDNVRSTLKFLKDGSVGTIVKKRFDDIIFEDSYDAIPVSHFSDYPCIAYSSKRDVQLYLKLVRKFIDEEKRFSGKEEILKRFRYFIISEYGETYFRPHYHALIFFNDEEISQYFVDELVHSCWQMCDEARTRQYVKYCDSGASSYLTRYVNSVSMLPKVYREVKQLRPFRLSSKSSAVGYNRFDKTQISEKVVERVDTYVKPVKRLGSTYVFRFPSDYLSSQFPKCYRYGKLSYSRLYSVYGLVFWNLSSLSNGSSRGFKTSGDSLECSELCVRLRSFLRPQDLNASLKCYKYCLENGCTPFHYLFILDLVWYRQSINSLRLFYEYQQKLADRQQWLKIARLYSNFADMRDWLIVADEYHQLVAKCFLESLQLDSADFDMIDFYKLNQADNFELERYRLELDDVLQDMIKKPKYNTLIGQSPDIV